MMVQMKYIFTLMLFLGITSTALPLDKKQQDDEPINKLTEILKDIADYDYSSRSWLVDLRDVMREIYSSPDLKEEAEKKMIGFLKSDASVAGKQVICQELEGFATKISIPVLLDLLEEPVTAEMALNALEMIPDESVDKALRNVLKKTNDWLKPGVIQTIGNRRDARAIKLLEKLAGQPDPLVKGSAVEALGEIGGEKALKAIGKIFDASEPPEKWEIAESYLRAADPLFSSGDLEPSFKIYREIYEVNPPVGLQIAALQGILKDPSADAEILFMNMLNAGDEEPVQAVVPVIRDYPGTLDYNRIAELFGVISSESQTALMIAFADRGNEAIRPAAMAAISGEMDRVRKGGLQSLLILGKPEDILVFAETAATSGGDVQDFARKCLYEMKGREADRIILNSIRDTGRDSGSGPAVRLELVRSIAPRNIVEGIPLLLELAREQDKDIKMEAIRATGVIGSPEIVGQLIGQIGNATGRAERNELIRTIVLLANKKPNPEDRSDEVLSALPDATENETLIAMIEILGNLGNSRALPVLRVMISHENREIQYAAIRALSQWPDDDPVMDLKEVAENSKDLKKRTLALQGYIKLLSESTTLSPDMKVAAYQKAFGIARSPEEKNLILSAVGKSGSVRGLEMVAGLLKNKQLRSEIQATFISLLKNIPDQFQDDKKNWINEALKVSDDPEFNNSIRKMQDDEK
jgi:HEAT repeat protein